MAHLHDIAKWYGVPAKRGQTVRYWMGKNVYHIGRITAASRQGYHLNALLIDANVRVTVHPFDLDYLVADEWVTGDSLKAKHAARIDAVVNRWMGGEK